MPTKLDTKEKIGFAIVLVSLVLVGIFGLTMSRFADGAPDWNDQRAWITVFSGISMIVSLLYVGLRAPKLAVASAESEAEATEEPQDEPGPVEEPKKTYEEEDVRPRYEKIARL